MTPFIIHLFLPFFDQQTAQSGRRRAEIYYMASHIPCYKRQLFLNKKKKEKKKKTAEEEEKETRLHKSRNDYRSGPRAMQPADG